MNPKTFFRARAAAHRGRILACALLLWAAAVPCGAADPAPVAAAADLKFALGEIAARFRQDTGRAVKLSFGSSGNFTQQIEHGAPFEVFLSADEQYVFRLAGRGLARDRGTLYAVGRVVLFAPHGSALKVDEQLKDLLAAVADGRVRRFAIANPAHAPYGRAARAALQHAGLWEQLQPMLVLGENAAQATQFAAAGSSQGGIVPLSLSRAPEVARLGSFALIPAQWHADEPLHQRMVLMKHAGDTGRAFFDYLRQPAARDIFMRHGFTLPGEAAR